MSSILIIDLYTPLIINCKYLDLSMNKNQKNQ